MDCLEFINTLIQMILGFLALVGLSFAGWKILHPRIKFTLISYYATFLDADKLGCALKVQTESSTELTVEDLQICLVKDGKEFVLKRKLMGWKHFIPMLKDVKKRDAHYKFTRPLEPELQLHGIKIGVNEYYVYLESSEELKSKLETSSPDIWHIHLKARPPYFFVPPWFHLDKRFDMVHSSDLQRDDSLIEKIPEGKVSEIVENL